MEVLTKGKSSEHWTHETTCTGNGWNQQGKIPCSSLLKVSADDIYRRPFYKMFSGTGYSYGFICPVCGCFTEIEERLLTNHILGGAKDYKSK